jgi:hypothetical protein
MHVGRVGKKTIKTTMTDAVGRGYPEKEDETASLGRTKGANKQCGQRSGPSPKTLLIL